jgi:tetratricopeptide (TPR) repeat protein
MKKITIFLFLLLAGWSVKAQQPDKECQLKMKQVDSLAHYRLTDDAFASWKEVRKKCPSLSEKLYTTGIELMKHNISATPKDEKEKAVRELLALYDDYDRYFPENKESLTVAKAIVLHDNKLGTDDEIYALLDKAFATHPEKFRDAAALNLYFELYYAKYRAGDKKITYKEVFAKEDAIEAQIAKCRAESDKNSRAYDSVLKSMSRLVKDIATCDNLSSYYGDVFEAKKTDPNWLESSAKKLLDHNCATNPLFAKLSETLQNLKPTARSSYNMGLLSYRSGKTDKAAEYFNQSADLSPAPKDKAATYFMMASTLYMGKDKAKVKEYTGKALKTDPTLGKAYLFLAQLYATSGADCSQSLFEQKAINWLAADVVKKAAVADPSLKATVEKLVQGYTEKAPTKDEIKREKMEGKTVTYGCWINESVQVPKN